MIKMNLTDETFLQSCGGPVDYTVRKLAERFSVINMKVWRTSFF